MVTTETSQQAARAQQLIRGFVALFLGLTLGGLAWWTDGFTGLRVPALIVALLLFGEGMLMVMPKSRPGSGGAVRSSVVLFPEPVWAMIIAGWLGVATLFFPHQPLGFFSLAAAFVLFADGWGNRPGGGR
jgi:hypothetical protein